MKSKTKIGTILAVVIIPAFFGLNCGGGGGGGGDSSGSGGTSDVALNVEYVPNYGQTCCSSSFTMDLNYYIPSIKFEDVFAKFGFPRFDSQRWKEFERWVEQDLNLQMETYNNGKIDDLIKCIDKKFPVVVLQKFNSQDAEGHNRVVIGYNSGSRILILNDPSPYGPSYRMGYDEFDALWNYQGYGTSRLLYLIYPKGSENPLSALTPYKWY